MQQPQARVGSPHPHTPHLRGGAGGIGRAPRFPTGAPAAALPKGNLRASSGSGEPSGQGALRRTPFAGALRWEEKLPSFPRSPTHFNELSGGTPPRRLPRIRPPGSPAPCKEASGGGWTLAAVSAWPGGRACPVLGVFWKRAGIFWKRAAAFPAQRAQPRGGSERRRRCRWQPALLPPAGSHGHGEIWPSRLLRRGNLFRASRRDRSLKASQLRGPSPPPATSSPRLRRERVNHSGTTGFAGPHQVRAGASQRRPRPLAAPAQPGGSRAVQGAWPGRHTAPGSSPITELGTNWS